MKQLLLFLICNLAFLLTVQGNSAEIPPAVMFKQLSTTEGLLQQQCPKHLQRQ